MNNHQTNRWPVTISGVLLILAGLMSFNALAQDDEEATEEAKKLDKVVITGSRIARTQIEGPSPIVIISRAQIDREGFTTVAGVLKSLSQANGVVQNEFQASTFTQNANSIDLRGLGPGRLLILIDGRRASDYPLPYNGQSNIVNISAIPLVAVDRIEILSGGDHQPALRESGCALAGDLLQGVERPPVQVVGDIDTCLGSFATQTIIESGKALISLRVF